MNPKAHVRAALSRTAWGARALQDARWRVVLTTTGSLCINLAYGLYHSILGIAGHSRWMMALGAYYTLLGLARFFAVLWEHKQGAKPLLSRELFVMRGCGRLLLLLGCALGAVNFISLNESIAARYEVIPMITIATYTFAKLTMVIVRMVRQRKDPSPLLRSLRRISCAEGAASALTLQRSMLVSFEGMSAGEIRLMNALTGAGVFVCITALSIKMIKESRGKIMAKSKFVQVNQQIAERITGAYQKIEGTVVGGYQKVENAVTGSYTKVEDAFVDRYLTNEGETVDQAKARLKTGTHPKNKP